MTPARKAWSWRSIPTDNKTESMTPTAVNGFEGRFGQWVVRRRWVILAATVAVLLSAGSGIRRLRITSDSRIFFSEGSPLLDALLELEETFNRDQYVFILIGPAEGHVFTRRMLTLIDDLTRQCRQIPYASRVDSLVNFPRVCATEDEVAVTEWFSDANSLPPAEIERLGRELLDEPLAVRHVVSADARVAMVRTTVLRPGRSQKEVPQIAQYALDMIGAFQRRHPDVAFHMTGSIAADFAIGRIGRRDLMTLIPSMLGVLVVVVGLTLRSAMPTIGTLAVIVMSMVTGLGLAGWLGITMNAASVCAPTLILTLAVADSVHIQSVALRLLNAGGSRAEAFAESLAVNLRPVFLTSITTAIGFATFNFSDSPPFRELGNVVALGVTAAFFYSVLSLPALMTVLPLRAAGGRRAPAGPACRRLAEFVVRRRRILVGLTLGASILPASGIAFLRIDDCIEENFKEDHWFREASAYYNEHMGGFHTIQYAIGSGQEGGICDPVYLERLDAFAGWYRSLPEVVSVVCLSDLMKRLNAVMGDDAARRLPRTREQAAQLLFTYEMSLGFGHDMSSRISVDKSSSRMVVGCRNVTSRKMRAIERQAEQWLRDNAPEPMRAPGTGLSMIWSHIALQNCTAMLWACLWALLLIAGIISVTLRSLKFGLLSLAPNVLPILTAFGIWGYLYGQFGLGLSIIAAMAIGIVVDDTVHFLCKYLHARHLEGLTSPDAVRYAFAAVGTAMWVTTVALVAGFCVLMFSGYRMNSDMGLMSAITVTLALVMDFFFMPPLLMSVDKT